MRAEPLNAHTVAQTSRLSEKSILLTREEKENRRNETLLLLRELISSKIRDKRLETKKRGRVLEKCDEVHILTHHPSYVC